MRISDWSSDVCSSDLLAAEEVEAIPPPLEFQKALPLGIDIGEQIGIFFPDRLLRLQIFEILSQPCSIKAAVAKVSGQVCQPRAAQQTSSDTHRVCGRLPGPIGQGRSEEHTSELQSLMRISYAVFCLKKKTKSN